MQARFYRWLGCPVGKRETRRLELTEKVRVVHEASRRIYGAPKVRVELLRQGVRLNRKTVARLMRDSSISGGELLLQHKFLLKLFREVRRFGIHAAMDTNGCFGDRLTDEDLASIDLVMLGLKAMDPELHRRLTKMDNAPAHVFARRLAALKRPMWIRFVIVPGWTDNMDEVGRMADFAAELGNVQRVDVLPFHQMGKFKWERLAMEYQLRDTQPPPKEKIDEAIARFKSVGVTAV